jgi:uncharacterized membrane protein
MGGTPMPQEGATMGETPMLRRSHLLLLALIVALAALLRFSNLSALGFWTDELCSLSLANGHGLQLDKIPVNCINPDAPDCTHLKTAGPFWQIPARLITDDDHPPLYFMLLRLWENCFGDTEIGVRSLNASLSLLAIVLLFFAARDSVGPSAALMACLLMAVATPQIQYAQEARNYMLVVVLSLGAFIALRNLQRSASIISATIFGLCLLGMMLTHFFAAGVGSALVAIALIGSRRKGGLLAIAAIALSAAMFLILWGKPMLTQHAYIHSGLDWLIDKSLGHFQRRLIDLCRLPIRFFAEFTDPVARNISGMIGGGLLLLLVIVFLRRRELRAWILWLIFGIGIVAGTDVLRSTTQLNWVRYSLFASPAAYVILAGSFRGKLRFLPALIAVFASLLCLRTAYVPPWKTDFRTPASSIASHLSPDDGLIITGPDPIADGIIYAGCRHYMSPWPTTVSVLTKTPDESMLARYRQCDHVWVISLWDQVDLPGFEMKDRVRVPYEVMVGRFVGK